MNIQLPPHLLVCLDLGISEECHRGSSLESPVLDVGLTRQVIRLLDGRGHPLHRQEGRQVGRVRGDQDQGEEPPDAAHDPGGGGPGVEV